MKHRGKILEEYVRKSGFNITKLGRLLPWTAKTIYRDFLDESLSYEKLLEYSRVLKYDFTDELPELRPLRFRVAEPEVEYKTRDKDEDEESVSYWKNKYITVLEKYTELLAQDKSSISSQAAGK